MRRNILIALGAASCVCAALKAELPEAKVTLRTVDETSHSISGVKVAVTFEMPKYRPGVWGSSEMLTKRGLSDNKGLFSATAKSGNYVGYGAEAPGFYPSTGKPVEFLESKDGRWQPWDPTVVLILKKIVHPIPMYARRQETDIPSLSESAGFDLIEADWVVPHGRGKSSDFVFKITKHVNSFSDFGAEMLISFSNPADGIALMPVDTEGGSELRSSHSAPSVGYTSSLSLLQGNSKGGGPYGLRAEEKGYYFRVRTIVDDHGQIVSALYGKIYGRIEYFPLFTQDRETSFYVLP
jgi:hypothetical protein